MWIPTLKNGLYFVVLRVVVVYRFDCTSYFFLFVKSFGSNVGAQEVDKNSKSVEDNKQYRSGWFHYAVNLQHNNELYLLGRKALNANFFLGYWSIREAKIENTVLHRYLMYLCSLRYLFIFLCLFPTHFLVFFDLTYINLFRF